MAKEYNCVCDNNKPALTSESLVTPDGPGHEQRISVTTHTRGCWGLQAVELAPVFLDGKNRGPAHLQSDQSVFLVSIVREHDVLWQECARLNALDDLVAPHSRMQHCLR